MHSIGIVFKQDEMILAALKEGISEVYLDDYRILPFFDFKEEEREGAILHNLEQFFKAHPGGKDNLFIGLTRDIALVQFLNLPMAVEENLRETLGFEMDRYTPFASDDVYFDHHVVKRFPESGLVHVMLVTIKKDRVDYYLELFKKLKIRPRGIEVTTTALFNLMHMHNAPPDKAFDPAAWIKSNPAAKTAFLKYGSKISPALTRAVTAPETQETAPATQLHFGFLTNDTYELTVTDLNEIYFSKTFKISAADPEGGHLKDLHDQGMRALVHLPVAEEADTGMRMYLSGKDLDHDFLSGAPEEMRLQFPTLSSLPLKPSKKTEDNLSALAPTLAVPVGLALKGLRQVKLDMNFIPPQLRPRKKRSKRKMLAVAAAVLVACSIGAYVAKSVVQMNLRHQILTEQVRELKREVLNIEDLQHEAEGYDSFAEAIESMRSKQRSKLIILEEITELLPMDCWLTEFNLKGADKKVKLSGYADSASQLIPLLEESSLFENVKFTSPITTDKKTNKEKFRLEMQISEEEKQA